MSAPKMTAGAGSSLAVDVILELASGPKPFARLLAATHGWQSTLSAAIASLLEDGLVGRSGSAFALTAEGCELVTRCRRGRPRRADRRN
jgi:hypothetical protein